MTGWLLDCLSPEQLLYWFLLLWLLVKVSDFEIRIISGGLVELVGPYVNDWIAVEVIDRGHEALFELLFGGDTDVAQDGGASLEKKPSTRLSQEPCVGVKVNSNLPAGCSASQARVSLEIC